MIHKRLRFTLSLVVIAAVAPSLPSVIAKLGGGAGAAQNALVTLVFFIILIGIAADRMVSSIRPPTQRSWAAGQDSDQRGDSGPRERGGDAKEGKDDADG